MIVAFPAEQTPSGAQCGMSWEDWRPRDQTLATAFDAWRKGDLTRAETLFEHQCKHEESDAFRGLGSVQWTQKRFVEARISFSKAIELAPWNPMHWGNLGLVLRDMEMPESALAALDTAIAIDRLYEPAWNEKANVLYDCKRYSEALPNYQQALKLNDNRAVVHHNIGMCYLALEEQTLALDAFDTALTIEPTYSWTLTMLRQLSGCQSAHAKHP